MSTPSHDLVALGATSFVGKILCRYLWEEFGAQGAMKWAAGGRSKPKLEDLRSSLGAKAGTLPLVVADAADEASLRKLCASTRVVVSTVGPYALYGEPLVKVCAESGTDYCDLSGEVQWIRRMLRRYEATARKSGARIVHCCGFDSIPSDLGVHFLQREAMKRLGAPCTRVKMRVKVMRGEFSGGTVASLMNVVKEAAADPALRKELADPYSLWPAGSAPNVPQPEVRWVEFDVDFGAWVAPFVMSGRGPWCASTSSVDYRLSKGWTPEEACGRAPRPHHSASTPGIAVKVQGHEFNSIRDAAKYFGRAYTPIFARLKDGCTIEQALGLVKRSDSLQSEYPELAKQWHPSKNALLTAGDVTPHSGQKVWWRCPNGHDWKAVISSRTRGHGCPFIEQRGVFRSKIAVCSRLLACTARF